MNATPPPEARAAAIRPGLLSASACAGMFVFGIVMALLGAVLPALSARMAVDLTTIGTLFLFMNGAMLACSLLLGGLMDRFGLKPPLALGGFLVAAALVWFTSAHRLSELFPAAVLLGMGGGALNGATNTLVTDLNPDARRKNAALNLLGVFFGFGALFLPFVIAGLITRLGMETILLVGASLCALSGFFAALLRFPLPKVGHGFPISEVPRFLRDPVVILMALLLLLQSGSEFTLGGYLSTYFTRAFDLPVDQASLILSLYWACLMLSRTLLSRLLLRVDGLVLVCGCAVVAVAGNLLAASAPSAGTAAVGVAVAGAGLAGIFPTLLGVAGARYAAHTGTVFGMLFTIALCGGMLMPWVAGHLAQRYSLRAVFALTAASFALIFLLAVRIRGYLLRAR